MKAIDIIKELANDGFGRIYEEYSGRHMYGKTCTGLYTDDPYKCIEEAASRGLRGALQDNLGKGYIVYWPNVKGY